MIYYALNENGGENSAVMILKWWHYYASMTMIMPGPSLCSVLTPRHRRLRLRWSRCQGQNSRDLFPSYFTNNQINLLCVRYESQPALEEGVCIDKKFKKLKLLSKWSITKLTLKLSGMAEVMPMSSWTSPQFNLQPNFPPGVITCHNEKHYWLLRLLTFRITSKSCWTW